MIKMEKLKKTPHFEPRKPPRPLFDINYLSELEATWSRPWGAQSNTDKLRTVMCGPGPDYEQELDMPTEERKKEPLFFHHPLGFRKRDVKRMHEQRAALVKIMRDEGVEVLHLEPKPPYVGTYGFRPVGLSLGGRLSVVINGGAIVCRPAFASHRGMEVFYAKRFMELGCPILYTVHGKGCLEASNFVWLDSKHVAIGVGLRTNMEGVDQVRPILARAGVEEIMPVHLTGHLYTKEYVIGGSSGFFHLDLVFGMADEDLGVIYPGGLPYLFVEYLRNRGIDLIEVPEKELQTAAANLLVLAPGKVVIPAGSEETTRELRKRGIDVIEVELSEFIPEAGPTCMTLPLIRRP